MKPSTVKYLKDLGELLGKSGKDTDYVVKSQYPLDYSLFEKLLDIEMQNPEVLNATFMEFETLPLSGRQIMNLSNNMNLNILLKSPTENQMKEILSNYIDVDMKQCVYPAKIVVLIVVYALYMQLFYKLDIFKDWNEVVKSIYERYIRYTYIEDKYSLEQLAEWSQWYLTFLLQTRTDFVQDYISHCMYLYDISYEYYKKEKPNLQYVGEGKRIRAGLYIPLANAMVDLRFNPYRLVALRKKYDYAISNFRGVVIRTLAPIIDYTLAVEAYLKEPNKSTMFVEKLSTLKNEEIIKILKEKKRIETKDPQTTVDLFPIEVACV